MLPTIERSHGAYRAHGRRAASIRSQWAVFCGAAVLAASTFGCGRSKWDLVPVEGTVQCAENPLADVQVIYWPDIETDTKAPRASAFTDSKGRYVLKTDAGDRGVVAGRYRVCIHGRPSGERLRKVKQAMAEEIKAMPAKASKKWKDDPSSKSMQIPPEYSDFNKTPLRVEVQPGSQIIDFNIP